MRCYACSEQIHLFNREACRLTVNHEDFVFDSFACLQEAIAAICERAQVVHAGAAERRAADTAHLAMAARRARVPAAWGVDPYPEGVRVLPEPPEPVEMRVPDEIRTEYVTVDSIGSLMERAGLVGEMLDAVADGGS